MQRKLRATVCEVSKVENQLKSGLDWFPTLVGSAGNPEIVKELKQGKTLSETTYKVHLDGYDQIDLISGNGPSTRHEVFYFAKGTPGAVRLNGYKYRFIDQPNGWLGGTVKPDFLTLVNLRLDPFERTGLSKPLKYYDFRIHEFWRIVFVQQEVAQVGETFVKFPPRQKGASFNFEVVKEQIFKAVKAWATK